jgi:hypothetical protein
MAPRQAAGLPVTTFVPEPGRDFDALGSPSRERSRPAMAAPNRLLTLTIGENKRSRLRPSVAASRRP